MKKKKNCLYLGTRRERSEFVGKLRPHPGVRKRKKEREGKKMIVVPSLGHRT